MTEDYRCNKCNRMTEVRNSDWGYFCSSCFDMLRQELAQEITDLTADLVSLSWEEAKKR